MTNRGRWSCRKATCRNVRLDVVRLPTLSLDRAGPGRINFQPRVRAETRGTRAVFCWFNALGNRIPNSSAHDSATWAARIHPRQVCGFHQANPLQKRWRGPTPKHLLLLARGAAATSAFGLSIADAPTQANDRARLRGSCSHLQNAVTAVNICSFVCLCTCGRRWGTVGSNVGGASPPNGCLVLRAVGGAPLFPWRGPQRHPRIGGFFLGWQAAF